jgi:hypothetical protein
MRDDRAGKGAPTDRLPAAELTKGGEVVNAGRTAVAGAATDGADDGSLELELTQMEEDADRLYREGVI